MVETRLTPAHTHPLEPLLNKPAEAARLWSPPVPSHKATHAMVMRLHFSTRHPVCVTVLLILVAIAGAGWYKRHAVLMHMAQLLVVEDPLVPVDLVVVSSAIPKAGALEAVRLYRAHLSPQIALTRWRANPIDDEMRRLGIRCLQPAEVTRTILERSGVAPDAIVVLPDPVDGTETEITAVAAFARQRRPRSFRLITARSHTARARWLLRRDLPPDVHISVGSSRFDPFSSAAWWQRREQSREVMSEYLHWLNTFPLGDLWSRRAPARPSQ